MNKYLNLFKLLPERVRICRKHYYIVHQLPMLYNAFAFCFHYNSNEIYVWFYNASGWIQLHMSPFEPKLSEIAGANRNAVAFAKPVCCLLMPTKQWPTRMAQRFPFPGSAEPQKTQQLRLAKTCCEDHRALSFHWIRQIFVGARIHQAPDLVGLNCRPKWFQIELKVTTCVLEHQK